MTYDEARALIDGVVLMREEAPEELAVKCKGVYPSFKSLCKKKFIAEKAGYKFRYQKELYKTLQPNTAFVEHYLPGTGTESMFARIDEFHTGTKEDPIPYNGNMKLVNGKYYIQDEVVYLCNRNTDIPVYQKLSDLVNLYVQKV